MVNERKAPSVGRALDVIDLLVTRATPISLSELAGELGMAKSSLHNVLAQLIDREWVERDPATLRLALGLRAWEVGQAYQRVQSLSQRAQPFLDSVRDELGETARLAVLSGTDHVCIAKSQGPHSLVFDQRIGARLPAHATGLGKALLTGLDLAELRELYADRDLECFTERTLGSVTALWQDLRCSRARGWVEDDGEFILGIRCIAVPIIARDGGVIAAMSVSVPTPRWAEARTAPTAAALQAAALRISQRVTSDMELA